MRTRFVLVVIVGAVLPLVLIGAWLVQSSRRAGEELLRSQLASALELNAADVATRWRDLQGELLLLADNDVAWRVLRSPASPDRAAPGYLVDVFRSVRREITSVRYDDAAGATRLTLPEESVAAGRDAGLLRPPRSVGAGPLSRDSAAPRGGPQIDVTLPVRDDRAAIVGSMLAAVDLSTIIGVQQQRGPAGSEFALVDTRTGTVIIAPPWPTEALAGGRFEWEGAEWLSVGHRLETPALELRLAAPLSPIIAPFADAARNGGLALLAVASLVILGTTWLTNRLTNAVMDATQAAEAIAAGRLDQRISVTRSDEVGRLGRALNTMAASLRETLDALSHQRAQAALGEFATSLAHEVRNAHTTIGVDLQRVIDTIPDRPAEHALLTRALRRVRGVDRVVNGALRVARSGRISPETIDLRDVLTAAARTVQPWYVEREAHLTVSLGSTAPSLVVGDATALETLFVNLMRNAAQALSAGGRAALTLRHHDSGIEVLVTDDGQGMTETQLASAFQPFVTTRADGTGLGLAIARQIALAHGGDITIDSAPGQGTRVVVRLGVERAAP